MKRADFMFNKNKILKGKVFLEEINNLSKDSLAGLIFKSEEVYHSQINELVSDFLSDADNKIILLAGPSSAGKTTSSHMIKSKLEEKNIHSISISLDDFFINRADTPLLPDGSYDFESIYALDLACFDEFIDCILTTGSAKMPLYDFLEGKRKPEYINIEMQENTVLIIEGLHALNPMLIQRHKSEIYRVYICLNTDFYFGNKLILPAKRIRLMRRCIRDYYSRGHSVSTSISMWGNVLRGEDMYIKPYKETADYIIDSTHLYEPLLYANYLTPLLEALEDNSTARTMIHDLNNCNKISKDIVPNNSLLWEFLVHK